MQKVEYNFPTPVTTLTGFTATWENVTFTGLTGSFDVVVTARLWDDDRVVEFDIDVHTDVKSHSLYAVNFPRVKVKTRGTQADKKLTIPAYKLLTETVQRYMGLLDLGQIRTFTAFGERMRDPLHTNVEYVDYLGAGDTHWAYQLLQLTVYGCFFINPEQAPNSFGVLLLNWTANGDELPVPAGHDPVVGGNKYIDYTVKLSDYGLSPGTYRKFVYFSDGMVSPSVIHITSDTYNDTVFVPERDAVFVKFMMLGG